MATDKQIFTDERIDEILATKKMQAWERDRLLADLMRFEECSFSAVELQGMADDDLMCAAIGIWSDYCRNQGLI